ncbi:rho gtpase activating protein, putative, partial [Entamoeba invadens IP1]|uniref:rho gtpase activating protein, putative n=1 Tax=Entamoeba invadens IP1 TaxID=370355 RepID=UPI0002C3EE46
MEYSSFLEIRGGQFKKFTKVFMQLSDQVLHVYTHSDKAKERLVIPIVSGIFHKKLSWLKKFPKESEELAFEICYDKIYQFISPSYLEYSAWLAVIPLGMKCNEIFGIPLSIGVKKSGWRFPLPLYRCIDYLERNNGAMTEGIFRISSSNDELKRVKEMFDGGMDIEYKNIGDVHVASGVIKSYLRELPDSVIPKTKYNEFLGLATTSNIEKELKSKIEALPDENKNILWLLIRFLRKVTDNTELTQMTPNNLAVCFSPSLFRSPDNDATREMTDAAMLRKVIITMIEKYNDVFMDVDKRNVQMGVIPPHYPAVIPKQRLIK